MFLSKDHVWSHWQKHCSAPRLWCDVTFSLLCIGSGDLLGFCVLSAASQNFLLWQTWCWTGNLHVWRWGESCEVILTSQMSSMLSKMNLKLLEEGKVPQDGSWFSRKLSASTNSRYQTFCFFLSTYQQPGYEARMIPAGVANCLPTLPAACCQYWSCVYKLNSTFSILLSIYENCMTSCLWSSLIHSGSMQKCCGLK